MRKLLLVAGLLLTIPLFAFQTTGIVVILGATLIDGTGRPALKNSAIVIENGRIRDIGLRGNVRIPTNVTTVNATGKWVIPGLIDAHVHLSQSGGLYSQPEVIDLRKERSLEDELNRIRERLPVTFARYLASGITGVVNIRTSTQNIDAMDLASRTKNAPRFAELIEVSLVLNPGDNLNQKIAALKAAVNDAHGRKMRVAAKVNDLAGAKAALEAGADILVHGVADRRVDNEFIDLLAKREVLYISTLMVEDGYRQVLNQAVHLSDIEQRLGDSQVVATWANLARLSPRDIPGFRPWPAAEQRPVSYDNLAALDASGARIVGASDAGSIGTLHGPALHRELELMVEAGLRPMEALVAATKNAAAVMGLQSDIGTLEKGKFADLVILEADPQTDIKNTRKISRVMKSGEFIEIQLQDLQR